MRNDSNSYKRGSKGKMMSYPLAESQDSSTSLAAIPKQHLRYCQITPRRGKKEIYGTRQVDHHLLIDMRAGESAIGGGSSSVGVGATDSVSRTYKMTFDEACNILNVKKDLLAKPQADESALQELLKNYEKMMKMNEKTSHYLQSKIVRARERIEAELPG